ncbi:MAG: T9SS type A sorting domain-containing protein [Ignavibacterium album]|uniref:choice-of-anchor V domain-containing protein n=1 Tax=Ignavibacterium album TaxID=591197 RepID=UPI0026F00274|nr:choice-of-anchor V domain-containing protein [Ignavibacterium album]MCX8105935.1 T9SS type A sorting domain-containing protein [Ignavibacterium album]
MKINLILLGIFISFVAFSYSGLFEHPTELLGGTELNGAGCVCHTVERDTTVKVWIEGPDTLMIGQTAVYHMYLAGGPAQAGGYNVAGRFGNMVLTDSLSFWDYRTPNELTQAFPLVFPSTNDTIYWEFGYTASDSSTTDTLYSCGLSIVYDGIPDSLDRWNFGPKFPITIIQNVIPVELVSFSAEPINNSIFLHWTTASEKNNRGFEVQRSQKSKVKSQDWETVAFVSGKGTSTNKNNYSFVDKNLESGKYNYRLKQIDFDGNYNFSNEIEVSIDLPVSFYLEQNFPNPFNPITTIRFKLDKESRISLKIFDLPGNEIATIIEQYCKAGEHAVEINSIDLNLKSGVYIYQLNAENYSVSKKMILLK